MKFFSIVLFFLTFKVFATFSNMPILMIGTSYFDGKTRIDDNGYAALGGISVGNGSYLSLGNALIRNKELNGFIINEANVGSTTFERYSCLHNTCYKKGKILGYTEQFNNILKRVAVPNSQNIYNAKYLIIGFPNDCIHSDAFGIPQLETQLCDKNSFKKTVDNITEIIERANNIGLTIIIPIPPKYKNLDLKIVQKQLNMVWVIDKKNYNEYVQFYLNKILAKTPYVNFLNIWKNFEHRGDGIHPNKNTVEYASKKIVKFIKNHSEK